MKIKYTNTAKDYDAFQTFHRNTRYWYRRIIHSLFLGFGVLVFVRYVFQHYEEQGGAMSIANGTLNAGIALVLMYVPLAFFERVIRWQSRRAALRGKNSRFLCEHSLELTDTELVEVADVGTSSIQLDAINSVTSKDGYTFIYLSSDLAHVIPVERVTEGNVLKFVASLQQEVAARKS